MDDYFIGIVQFDEMETYEGAKAKQLSIALAICANSGKILDINACRKPTSGRLAGFGKRHYGWTVDERKTCASGVLAVVSTVTNEKLKIVCDKKTQYPKWIHAHMPHAEIVQVKSRGRKKSTEIIEPTVVVLSTGLKLELILLDESWNEAIGICAINFGELFDSGAPFCSNENPGFNGQLL